MLIIDYNLVSYLWQDSMHIEYDMVDDDVRLEYLFNDNQMLRDYEYDYDRLCSILTKENVEKFFKRKLYRHSQAELDNMPTDMPSDTIEVEYEGKKKTICDGEYTKRPIALVEHLYEYIEELRMAAHKQQEKFWELKEIGITLEGDHPSVEVVEKYRSGLMWESLSYGESKPTAEERKAAAERFKVPLEACERYKLYWWSKLKQHHEIKWLK